MHILLPVTNNSFLNQQKGDYHSANYFMINLYISYVAELGFELVTQDPQWDELLIALWSPVTGRLLIALWNPVIGRLLIALWSPVIGRLLIALWCPVTGRLLIALWSPVIGRLCSVIVVTLAGIFFTTLLFLALTLKVPTQLKQTTIFFFIFQRKQVLTFHVNHLLGRWFTWNVKTCFLWKIKKKEF